MDNIFLELIKTSPVLAIMVLFWWYTRKDYEKFVDRVQQQNELREAKFQETIDKLIEKFDLLSIVKGDVEDIKNHIFK